jgi:hypothetical protein
MIMELYKESLLNKIEDDLTGRNQNWDAIETHMAEDSQKHITESGSNDDGYYIRYDDGTQICNVKMQANSITSYGAGTYADPYRTNSMRWNFPVPYIAKPGITATAETVGIAGHHRAMAASVNELSNTHCDMQIYRLSSSTSETEPWLNALAVGRWK